jgi:hypothetical protein
MAVNKSYLRTFAKGTWLCYKGSAYAQLFVGVSTKNLKKTILNTIKT